MWVVLFLRALLFCLGVWGFGGLGGGGCAWVFFVPSVPCFVPCGGCIWLRLFVNLRMRSEWLPVIEMLKKRGGKLGVVGSRDWDRRVRIFSFVSELDRNVVVVSGGCRGVDEMVRGAVAFYKLKFEELPADWGRLGESAGPVRNEALVRSGIGVLVVFLSKYGKYGSGSKDVMERACKFGVPVFIFDEERLVGSRVQLELF